MSKTYFVNIILVLILSIGATIGLSYKSHEDVKEKTSKDSALIISQMVNDSFNNINKDKKHESLYNTISSIEKFKYVNTIHFERSEDFDFADEPNKLKTEFVMKKNSDSISFSIPINAQWQSTSDCRACHNIFYGEEVGVLKLELAKVNDELPLVYFVPFIILFSGLFILYLSQKAIKQNNSLYIKLSRSLSSALNGKYKKVASDKNTDTIGKYNELIGVFEETTNFIDRKSVV